jgi:hypothetical protein
MSMEHFCLCSDIKHEIPVPKVQIPVSQPENTGTGPHKLERAKKKVKEPEFRNSETVVNNRRLEIYRLVCCTKNLTEPIMRS